ncbi:SPOR domain-containing protein [Diaphorobacter ruginosibacter]|uniref:SPOR domain-containing protein n=1 Tax=Diaphorobacter ruginosibacter TaxID=1715720 RepID=UPI00334060AC
MLRIAVLLLALANAGYYAWSQGMLRGMGYGPAMQSEPQRAQQQIDPQKMEITPATPTHPAASASASLAAPQEGATPADALSATAASTQGATGAQQRTVCLQAGSFDESQAQAWRAAARDTLADTSWKLEPASVSGRWMVYMGKLADEEAVAKKRTELRGMQIDYDRPGPSFEPGLSLGRFSTEEAAQRALTQLANKGVRTARVVLERREATVYTLTLPAVDDALRGRLGDMKSALAGKTLQSCS